MARTTEAALWRRRAMLYEDELVRLRNTFALLADGIGPKKAHAGFARAFIETVRTIEAVLVDGRARVQRRAVEQLNPLVRQDCPVYCGHDDSSWCNEDQLKAYRRAEGRG